MSYRHVFVDRKAYLKLRSIVRKTYLRETGGPMVGYITTDNAVVITDIAGPGPKSKLNFLSVTIDGEYSQQFCDRIYYQTEGVCDYVGDWHCHPSFSTKPSTPDNYAIKQMAGIDGVISSPLSIIYSRITKKHSAYYWDRRSGLEFIQSTVLNGLDKHHQ